MFLALAMKLVWRFEPVKVEFHLDNGYTKIVFQRLVSLEMLDGDWFTDIPTIWIPLNLRQIGSVFLLSWQSSYAPGNIADVFAAYSNLPVVELKCDDFW